MRMMGLAAGALMVVAWSCASSEDDAGGPGGAGAGGVGGAAGSAGADSDGGVTPEAGEAGGAILDAGLPPPDANCGTSTTDARRKPLHLYVMVDKSSSMSGNPWQVTVDGLSGFVQAPSSTGIVAGVSFFPRPADGNPLCDQKAYATPVIPFGALPGHAPTVVTGLQAAMPNGLSTPTWPALGGAILKSLENANNNPGESAAVLLVTDGVPQGPAATCAGVDPESFAEIAKLASVGASQSPPVTTFVIGLPGVDQSFANQVAMAGGSGSAILIGATNPQVEFQNALEKVRGQALPCDYEIPGEVSGGMTAVNRVNVTITDGKGNTQTVPQTPDCATGAGWYYDQPDKPTKIILCPAVCDPLKSDFDAKLEIVLGCPTQIIR